MQFSNGDYGVFFSMIEITKCVAQSRNVVTDYTGSRLQRVRSPRALVYNQQIALHDSHQQQCSFTNEDPLTTSSFFGMFLLEVRGNPV